MPKNPVQGWFHHPLEAILGTRAKIGVLRSLHGADGPLSLRELGRRTGLAVRSVELAVADLLAVGILERLGAGRERLVVIRAGHRLAPALGALLEVEGGHWASLRVELRTLLQGLGAKGVVAGAIVGTGSLGTERIGDQVELLVLLRSKGEAATAERLLEGGLDPITRRFGVAVRLHLYDLDTARAMWRSRTPTAAQRIAEAEEILGGDLASWLEAG